MMWKSGMVSRLAPPRTSPSVRNLPVYTQAHPASPGTGLPPCRQRRSDTEKRSIFLEDIHQVCVVILEAAERQPSDDARQCLAEDSNESLA